MAAYVTRSKTARRCWRVWRCVTVLCGKHQNPPNDLPAGVGGAGLDLLTCLIRYSTSMHNLFGIYGLYLSSKPITKDLNRIERAALQMTQVFNLATIV